MALTIYQLNIRCWNSLKYSLLVDLSNYQPDIILLNETGLPQLNIPNIRGYSTLSKSNGRFTGAAILIKQHLQYELLPVTDQNTVAIKLQSNLGPLIIATSYCAPSQTFIPTTSIYKILSHNLPTVFIGDFNAHSPLFDNCPATRNYADAKGKTLENIFKSKSLQFLGPYFSTYIMNQKRGKPDIIFANKLFSPFHYLTEAGTSIGSDHIPIIFRISTKPFKIPIEPRKNINKIEIQKYKTILSQLSVPDLNLKPITEIDTVTNSLIQNIMDASDECCPTLATIPIQQYEPTPKIKRLLRRYQAASFNFYRYGTPTRDKLNIFLRELVDEVTKDKNNNWNKIIKEAVENYGNPKAFWSKVNRLLSRKSSPKTQTLHQINPDNSVTILANHQDMANLMSTKWESIFKEHEGPQFINPNVNKVTEWFNNFKSSLNHLNIIDHSTLIEDHPLIRPIIKSEILNAIKFTKNKAPGLSGMRQPHLFFLPSNCINILENLYNSMLASRYLPLTLHHIKMVFLNKPLKPKTDPLNYRPICLIEIIFKIFEKIIAQRFLYFLEHNNLITERQFGFRPNRGTQHSIALIKTAIAENTKQKYTSLVATRDVEKAFDTVWFPGLLYKLNLLPTIPLEFLSLTYQFLTCRIIHPHFQNCEGNSFSPKAGVPQGSSSGPGYYSVLVNDHPQPLYITTLIMQFADDFIHIIRSNTKYKLKNIMAKNRLLAELKQTYNWECNWKIKSNPSKIAVCAFGTTERKFNKLGPLIINNKIIPISKKIKVLGYNLSINRHSSHHITTLISKAKIQLNKLNRFKTAPPKIKLILYKTLIRPLIEYPSLPLALSNKTQIRKLQKIQNAALRFVNGTSLKDKISMSSLHKKFKIDAFNVRTYKLAKKCLNTILNTYSSNTDSLPIKNYKYSDYIIKEEPLRKRRRPIIQRINKYLCTAKKCKLYSLNKTNNWDEPQPMFT